MVCGGIFGSFMGLIGTVWEPTAKTKLDEIDRDDQVKVATLVGFPNA